MTQINKIRLIDLSNIEDPSGNLSFIVQENQIFFIINRVYWIYDVPSKTGTSEILKKN